MVFVDPARFLFCFFFFGGLLAVGFGTSSVLTWRLLSRSVEFISLSLSKDAPWVIVTSTINCLSLFKPPFFEKKWFEEGQFLKDYFDLLNLLSIV